MDSILTQIIGFVGTGLILASFQFRSAKVMFLMQGLGCVCFSVHFSCWARTPGWR